MKSVMLPFKSHFKPLLEQGLKDDGWPWDWTSLCLPDREVRARIIAKTGGVWAGKALCEAANQVYAELSSGEPAWPGLISALLDEGSVVETNTVCCELKGRAQLIMALERPLLNLIGYASGVATQTRAFVDKIHKASQSNGDNENAPRVTATRKTLPGYRDLSVYGLICGGGVSHRVNLSGGVLIKENHIAAYGGIKQAVLAIKSISPHGLKIEVEVTQLSEMTEALEAGADVIMLDNFTPKQVREALSAMRESKLFQKQRPLIEVSGGIRLETVSDFVLKGIDVISVGSLTHSVRALDLSLLICI